MSRILVLILKYDYKGVTSDSGQADPLPAGPSLTNQDDIEEGREAEAATKNNESKLASQPIPTTGNTARRSSTGRIGRMRGNRTSMWPGNAGRGRNMDSAQGRRNSITPKVSYISLLIGCSGGSMMKSNVRFNLT